MVRSGCPTVDHGHLEVWQHQWGDERRHMQNRIMREMNAAAKKKKAAAAEAAKRRALTTKKFHLQASLDESYRQSRKEIAMQESAIRSADTNHGETREMLQHEFKTVHTLSRRAHVEEHAAVADKLAGQHGAATWHHWMDRGAKDVGLERREEHAARVNAVRGFGWAKNEEAHDRASDVQSGTTRLSPTRLAITRLPTSPLAA